MVSIGEYLSLTDKMVDAVFPGERDLYDLSKQDVAQRLFTSEPVLKDSGPSSSEFQFIQEATTILQFIGLMVGTFDSILKITDRLKEQKSAGSSEDIVETWKKKLCDHGIEAREAERIVEQFRSEMLSVLNKSLRGEK